MTYLIYVYATTHPIGATEEGSAAHQPLTITPNSTTSNSSTGNTIKNTTDTAFTVRAAASTSSEHSYRRSFSVIDASSNSKHLSSPARTGWRGGRGGGGGGAGARRSGTLQEWPLYVPELHGEDIPKNHAVCIAVVPKRLCVCPTMAHGHQADVCLSARCGMEGHVCFKSRAGMLDPNHGFDNFARASLTVIAVFFQKS